jgi:hypothetical protein
MVTWSLPQQVTYDTLAVMEKVAATRQFLTLARATVQVAVGAPVNNRDSFPASRGVFGRPIL